ncbi:MAG: ABC transporter substrate-binding protein [Halanaerobiaceae bacterium]
MRQNIIKNYVLLITLMLIMFFFGTNNALAGEVITVTDSDGYEVEIELPVKSIVCLSSALNELLVVLDAGDKIVGRDDWSDISVVLSSLEGVPIVASSSFRPQIEAIIELQPDIIITDTMLQDDARKTFNSFGIPTIAERTSEASNLFNVITKLGKIVDNQEKAEELIEFIAGYRNLIKERTANLGEDEKTRIYWEWRGKYKSGSSTSTIQPRIDLVGGVNICADTQGDYPEVSSEYVIQEDPELIIRMESRRISLKKMKESWKEVMTRTGLKNTSAVKNGRVHIISWAINSGLPSIVGDLYYAKLAHPELFVDIEPMEVYEDLMNKFFGIEADENSVFPKY